MSARTRLVLFVAAATLALGAVRAQAATTPPLYVTYDANGNLSVSVSGGVPLGSSTAIPPGPYWVTFDNEFSAERIVHKWHLTGPGVDVSTLGTDLNCDSSIEQYVGVLQPSSTYTVQDDFHPSIRPVVFRTSATGSSTSAQSASSARKTGPGVTSSDIVGSDRLPYRGSLTAVVGAHGKLSFTRGRKPFSSLRAGRYTVRVVDASTKAAFILEKLAPTRLTVGLTSAPFVGRRSVAVRLGAGRWLVAGGSAPSRAFVVST
jgi:hypothetical protein